MVEHVLLIDGRQIYPSDLELVQRVAAQQWEGGFSAIVSEVCRLWAWRRHDGSYSVELCGRVLIRLCRLGLVELPGQDQEEGSRRKVQGVKEPLFVDISPMVGGLSDFAPPRLEVVCDGEAESLWTGLVERYHYLGNRTTIGNHLKYLAFIDQRPVGLFLWGPAVLHLAPRDRWLGWTVAERRAGLHRLANNHRFLVLPWVRIKFLASHLLAQNLRRLSRDWEESFGHGLDLVETFVDPDRFTASSYLAANWLPVGLTQGNGRRGADHHFHGHRKLILLYPLRRAWRRQSSRSPPLTLTAALAHRGPDLLPLMNWPLSEREQKGEQPMIGVAPCSTQKPLGELTPADLEEIAAEFTQYHQSFEDVFSYRPQFDNAYKYVRGLLTPTVDRKNVERIVLYGDEEANVRTMQDFLTASPWSNDAVRIRHQQLVAQNLGHPEGVLITDGSGIPKKGKESSGVARQYCGATGKVDNCQMGVFLCYASVRGATLIDAELYLPESWFTAEQIAKRWPRCRIPADTTFQTKPQLALEMIIRAHERGQLPLRWVLGDEEFGRDTVFLDRLPKDYWYFCEVPCNTRFWVRRPETELVTKKDGSEQRRLKKGKPKAVGAQQLLEQLELTWQTEKIKEGAKGPIIAEVARVRVIEVRDRLPGNEVWLFVRRSISSGELKFFVSDAPVDVSMEEMIRVCGSRWAVETCLQEDKGQVGLDEYEVRSFPGWHHHMTLVMLAHHFLVRVRQRQKKTPPA